MITEQDIFKLSYGMSAMAASHKNDLISCRLASLADRITRIGPEIKISQLSEADIALIRYYNANK